MTKKPVSYYDILEVSPQATDDEIHASYRRLALKYHPDKNPQKRRLAELRFRLISEAYAELKTREKRVKYNKSANLKGLNSDNDNKLLSRLRRVLISEKETHG